MAPSLILYSNNAANNYLSVDVSQYLDLTPEGQMDTYDPGWSSKVISHSLLKEGGVLALEDRQAKALTFPLKLNSVNKPALHTIVQQINQCLNSPGATYSWQDTGASQATVFDSITGELAIKYHYRRAERFWLEADLKLYVQPLGRTVGPRAYAAASGVGPLLMISPYSASATQIIGQSTQAGVAGWGGAPRGASSGIFYSGSPSLAGDAPSLLQLTYLAAPSGCHPSTSLISLLPAPTYQPEQKILGGLSGQVQAYAANVFGGSVYQYVAPGSTITQIFWMNPGGYANGNSRAIPDQSWAGQHRVMVLARASGTWGQLYTFANAYVPITTTASIQPSTEWGLYDLGTYAIRPSQFYSNVTVGVGAALASVAGVGSNCAIDICGIFTFPDATTVFFGASSGAAIGNNNTVLVDDTLGEINALFPWQAGAPSPPPANNQLIVGRLTPLARGNVPRPDPKIGLPVLAILTVGASSAVYPNRPLSAQVNVLERTRYMLP